MALIVADRVRENSTTTGTGTLTLSGSPLGYQTFSAAVGNGNTTYYAISNPGVNEWEVGIGTVGAGTLARTTVIASSTGTALIDFTAGNKDVFCTYPAEVSVFAGNTQTLTNKTISVDDNTVSGIAASSFVVSNASGNIDGAAAQKAIPTGAVVGTSDSQVLTNKTISGANNTLSNIGNASLSNPSVTVGSTNIALGATSTTLAGLTSVTSSSFVGPLTGNADTVTNGVYTVGDQTIGGTKTFSSNPVLNGATANGVAYLNGSKVLTTGSALTFDGTNLGTTGDMLLNNARYYYGKTSGGTNVRLLGINSGNSLYVGIDSGPSDMILNASSSSSNIQFLASGSEQMRLTSTGLGIGTSSPVAKLDVVDTSTTNLVLARIRNNSTAANTTKAVSLYLALSDTAGSWKDTGGITAYPDGVNVLGGGLYFSTRAGDALSEKMRLDASGNLGLGVTPSAWASGRPAIEASGFSLQSYSANYLALGQNEYVNSSLQYIYKTSAAASLYTQISGTHAWYTAPSGTAGNAISFTQAMTLDASGNLGVGLTAPSSFAGYSSIGVNGSTGSIFDLFVGASRTSTIVGTASETSIRTLTASPLVLYTNSTERMRIDSSGNVGIGTSSPDSGGLTLGSTSSGKNVSVYSSNNGNNGLLRFFQSSGTEEGQVYAGAGIFNCYSRSVLRFSNNSVGETARIDSSGNLLVGATVADQTTTGIKLQPGGATYFVRSESTNSNSTCHVYSTGAAAYRFYVGMGGTVYATNTTISAISDQRYKENIRDLDVGLDAVMALKPRVFDWKAGKGKDIKNDRGFIAQEFEQVFPDLIDEWKDPAPEGEDPYKSVRQDLIPVLVKAIQELKAELDATKAEVAALKGV